ncbi:MAG: DnaD domain protein, partial [Malacoplasma sp.]|nr:DnaD domain protein [Malacoplasma sp.]
LSSIYNTKISDEERMIINQIRNEFLFPDYVINIMIDFSLPITHSELNLKYLKKMGKTFKVNNVSSLEEIYDFLFKWKNREIMKNKITSNKNYYPLDEENYGNYDSKSEEYFEISEKINSDDSSEEDLVSLEF